MADSQGSAEPSSGRRLVRAAQVIVVSSVMFTFISYWRTAAVVLCDLASTAYYIGGIVEQSIGPAAPFFILGVMLFSYAVRSVYIESCALFVRGGVYRVVKEAMGGFLAKLSVSALMFDYILTGPISGVSAGQYLIGLALETIRLVRPDVAPGKEICDAIKAYGSAAIAILVTLYFFRQNLRGIHESSEKALKIVKFTTVMALVMLIWGGITLAVQGPAPVDPGKPELGRNTLIAAPNFDPKMNYDAGHVQDPLGFISDTSIGERLRHPESFNWLSLIGLLGLGLAFGHSILAMSGEETLAQVYREVEAPKLPNFKKAAFVVFVYSLCLTAGMAFLAILLVPDSVRMPNYSGNLIGGLAMHVLGPPWARLLLNCFVVVVGFFILSGAVNTAIIGSNGVLNRVAEDGVVPEWFRKPHPRYGTTHRILYLILILQVATIVMSRGNVIVLGEAYAFGVVWSFVFKALAMLVLRFRRPGHRQYKVPFNPHIGGVEIPLGLGAIFAILFIAAVGNLLTKETATIWGLAFTATFLTVFIVSERVHERRRRGSAHAHLEQFNQQTVPEATAESLTLHRQYRKLVAIRSPQNLFMLEKALAETDPRTTDLIVMTAKVEEPAEFGDEPAGEIELHGHDQQLMTAVVDRAEAAGKHVQPLIVPTNNALYAVLRTAQGLRAQELLLGLSNKFSAEDQLDQIALYWLNLNGGQSAPLTVRILGRGRDVRFDLGGGSPIPTAKSGMAQSVAELRASGVGVRRVLLVHDGTEAAKQAFDSILTMLDSEVDFDILTIAGGRDSEAIEQQREVAAHTGRQIQVHEAAGDFAAAAADRAAEGEYDLLVVASAGDKAAWIAELQRRAPCSVAIFAPPPQVIV